MTDWGLAVRIAAGGFGMVFFLLIVLSILISVGARLVTRNAGEKGKK